MSSYSSSDDSFDPDLSQLTENSGSPDLFDSNDSNSDNELYNQSADQIDLDATNATTGSSGSHNSHNNTESSEESEVEDHNTRNVRFSNRHNISSSEEEEEEATPRRSARLNRTPATSRSSSSRSLNSTVASTGSSASSSVNERRGNLRSSRLNNRNRNSNTNRRALANTSSSSSASTNSARSFSANNSNVQVDISLDVQMNNPEIDTSDTEAYDVDIAMGNVNENVNNNEVVPEEDDDDDVILVPQVIETVDLCTQAVSAIPAELHNQVIDITDSPTQNFEEPPLSAAARRLQRRNGLTRHEIDLDASVVVVENTQAQQSEAGPVRNNLKGNRAMPYQRTKPAEKKANLSLNSSQTDLKVGIQCPVCLESVIGRNPVSTVCGHIFCRNCLLQALGVAKACPNCRKKLTNKNSYHNIFFPS